MRPLICLLLLALSGAGHVRAQTPPPANPPEKAAPQADGLATQQDALRAVEDRIRASQAERQRIEAEIESVRSDRAKLAAALVDATAKVQAAEAALAAIESRIARARSGEAAIARSLEARRGLIVEILAGLQRMSRDPPPALLIAPGDILTAIRTAMTMGAVLPELRAETQTLASDLAELGRLRAAIAREGEAQAAEIKSLASEGQRLAALVAARREAIGASERALTETRERAALLSRQALDLKDLIARLEAEAIIRPQDRPGEARDTAKLQPARAFSQVKAQLPFPVAGQIVKRFGEADGFGGAERGFYMAARPGAVVAAPADGWVLFSGPFRTFGQLLIVNAGGGYYILLAGLQRVSVEVGQFVLTGEPVGVMGDASARNAAALAIGATQPILYVEFRKDGSAIDSAPWWARPAEKVRG